MDKEKFAKAAALNSEINYLKGELNGRSNVHPQSGLEIKIKTGYSDMGHDIERTIQLRDDIAIEVYSLIREKIEKQIKELELEFEKL